MKSRNSLHRIRIASPCPVDWEGMTGDDRVRFCNQCNLSVYNIAELSRSEAEDLIASTEGRICARLYRRVDGTVITRDCPVGLRAIRRRVTRTAAAVFAAGVALASSAFGQKAGSKDKTSCRPQIVTTTEPNQSPANLSQLNGTILDPAGAVIPGAQVTIKTEATDRSFKTSSDDKGNFLIAGVESGTYNILVTAPGFKKLQLSGVKLKNNEKLTIEVTMLVDASSITMGIIALDPLIESPPGTMIFNDKMIQRLPIHED